MLGAAFYRALDRNECRLTDEARQAAPSVYRGLGWLTRQMEASEPITAPRRLSVEELWEYKPRLMFAGDGSAARPHQWNRDWFAFLPYQLAAGKFLVPYYVATVDAYFAWNPERDIFDPARYAMPEQEFEVVVGNCAGADAKVSAYDPLTNESVPVELVKEKCSANRLAVKVKSVDYPRFLLIEEAEPGVLIEAPQVAVDEEGLVTVAWRTNIPAESVKITYGNDWPNRGANEKILAGGVTEYHVSFPARMKGILAARIFVEANGLSCVWPRWDEDPQGQVVIPGSSATDVRPLKFSGPVAGGGQGSEEPLAVDSKAFIKLPIEKRGGAYPYILRLPEGVTFTGPEEDQEAQLGEGKSRVRLRLRHIVGGNRNPVEAVLPFLAVGMNSERGKSNCRRGSRGHWWS